jgi:4'-phosphopantetheinyl transferase
MPSPTDAEIQVWRVELPPGRGQTGARGALGRILAAALGEVGSPALTHGPHGKPRLAIRPQRLSFNLSHSGGLALVAVAAGGVEIGIDVELIRPRRDLLRLAARWLPAADATAIAAAPAEEREEVFYAAWTRFEARAKCTGAGLSGPPPGPEVVALPLAIDPGYAAALATVGTAPTTVHRLDFARLDTHPQG